MRRALLRAWYERGLAVDTSQVVGLEELGLEDEERVGYAPCGWRTIQHALDLCDLEPDDVLVDLGCGPGRVVAQAARRNIRRVVGVEISSVLVEQAQLYIDGQRGKLRAPVELVVSDAKEWAIPDDVTVFFINNPFLGSILQTVVANIGASLERSEREIRVVYANPKEPEHLLGSGLLELVTEVHQGKPGGADDFMLLRSVAPVRPTDKGRAAA